MKIELHNIIWHSIFVIALFRSPAMGAVNEDDMGVHVANLTETYEKLEEAYKALTSPCSSESAKKATKELENLKEAHNKQVNRMEKEVEDAYIKLKALNATVYEKTEQLKKKDEQVSEMQKTIKALNATVNNKDEELKKMDHKVAEQQKSIEGLNATVNNGAKQKDDELKKKDEQLKEKDQKIAEQQKTIEALNITVNNAAKQKAEELKKKDEECANKQKETQKTIEDLKQIVKDQRNQTCPVVATTPTVPTSRPEKSNSEPSPEPVVCPEVNPNITYPLPQYNGWWPFGFPKTVNLTLEYIFNGTKEFGYDSMVSKGIKLAGAIPIGNDLCRLPLKYGTDYWTIGCVLKRQP